MLLWVRVKALKQIQTKPQHFGQLPNLHCIIYYIIPAKNPHVQIFGHKILKPQPLASKICSWLVFAAPQELDFNWLGDGKSSSVKEMIATFSDLILALAARCRNFPGSSWEHPADKGSAERKIRRFSLKRVSGPLILFGCGNFNIFWYDKVPRFLVLGLDPLGWDS